MSDFQVLLIVYGFLLGWLLHSKKHGIIRFFKHHLVEIAVGLIVAWPILSIALFWINIRILQSDILMYPILASMLGFVAFWIWIMRTGKKEGEEVKK